VGGVTTLLTAAKHMGVASSVLLVDVVPRMRAEGMERISNFMHAHTEGFNSLDEAANAVAAYLPGRPKPNTSTGLMKNLRKAENGKLYCIGIRR